MNDWIPKRILHLICGHTQRCFCGGTEAPRNPHYCYTCFKLSMILKVE